jgi:hypothetical protein
MAYRMILNETSYFGPGSISCIVDEVKKRGDDPTTVMKALQQSLSKYKSAM